MAKRVNYVTYPDGPTSLSNWVLLPDSTIEETDEAAALEVTHHQAFEDRELAVEATEKAGMARLSPFWAAFVVSELGGKLVRIYDRGGDVAYLWTLRGEYPAVGR